MRICYIGSTGIHTRRWVEYFAGAGHEVHPVTSEREPDFSVENVTLHILKRHGTKIRAINYLVNTLPLLKQFKRLIKEIAPDIVHAHYIMETAFLVTLSGFHPFVVTAWGSDVLVTPRESGISRLIAGYVLKRADLVTCDAEHIQKPLIQLGADPEKIKLIYFGVDTQKFNPREKDEKLAKELGILNSPTVISLRRFEPVYNVESLIRAVPIVLEEVPTAKFLLIEKGSEEARLKELARSLGVSNNVIFKGWVPASELPQYISLSDVYVSTSLSDAGLAASTGEAMAYGLPVVTTDFGDNSKWVEDGVNGFLVPLRNPEALASKIICLLQNEELRKRFGQANRRLIEERNNWEVEMDKMGNLYAGLAEKRQS